MLTSARLEEVLKLPRKINLAYFWLQTSSPVVPSLSLTFPFLMQLQYLQVASFAHNQITSTEGIAHPLLETLNISCKKKKEKNCPKLFL